MKERKARHAECAVWRKDNLDRSRWDYNIKMLSER
jgi:hypothetical protein